MSERRERLELEGTSKINIGKKKDNLEIKCLAFADDLAKLTKHMEDARSQINILKETAEKADLQILYETTENRRTNTYHN